MENYHKICHKGDKEMNSCTRICVIFILFRVSWWQWSESWELMVVGIGGTRKMWGDGLGFLGSSEGKKNPPAVQETQIRPLGQKDSLKKEMATHSSILACRIPWTEEPGRLQSMGSQRVGHYLSDFQVTLNLGRWYVGKESTCQCRRHQRHVFNLLKIPWSREQLPTPVFLPEKFHGQRSLVATVHRVLKSWTQLSITPKKEKTQQNLGKDSLSCRCFHKG